MTRRSKDIGTAAESATVKYLQSAGFPFAERRALRGILDAGDITGTPGICWEVKGGQAARTASDGQVSLWLEETEQERRNAHADIGVLVMQRGGIGPGNAGRWWAVVRLELIVDIGPLYGLPPIPVRLHLSAAVHLVRRLGYGEPFVDDVPVVGEIL